MVRFTPFNDAFENMVIAVIFLLAASFVFATYTSLDAELRFAFTDTAAYFSNPPENSLQFKQSEIEFMNSFSGSLGSQAFADERLFCGSVSNRQVTSFRFADSIDASSLTSVAGGCTTQFGGVDVFVHTQPGSGKLSQEDKNVESPTQYSCIAFQEIAVSPSGSVQGLNCWKVSGVGENAEFTPVSVKVS